MRGPPPTGRSIAFAMATAALLVPASGAGQATPDSASSTPDSPSFPPPSASAADPGSSEVSPGLQLPMSPAQIARRAVPAVVEVATYGGDGEKLGGGSGFLAASEGLVVTSHHVLEGAKRAEVILATGDAYEVRHVTATDARRDLVVLRVGGFDLPTVALGDSRPVHVGDPVVVIGSPLGLTGTVSDGLVSAKREMEGRRVLQISAPISKGSSGGPVFDARGRVIGVLAGFLRKGQNVNFAVPVEYVRGLLELPGETFSVESVGRKRVALLGGGGATGRELSLQAVLRGEPVPGEEETPWALQPRRVDPERVKERPVAGASELTGLWELRELTRVPHTKSGLYRGVLVAEETGLEGTFFGSLVQDPEFDAEFSGDRVRGFDVQLGPGGRATLEGAHGCSYFVHASDDAMAGVYECTGADGDVYDLGAVELRRIRGEGPSGTYAFTGETPLGSRDATDRGEVVVYALGDGRWVGKLVVEATSGRRIFTLDDGRWTDDGHLSARLARSGSRVRGTFDPAGATLEFEYSVGGEDFPVRAGLRGTRTPAPTSGRGASTGRDEMSPRGDLP